MRKSFQFINKQDFICIFDVKRSGNCLISLLTIKIQFNTKLNKILIFLGFELFRGDLCSVFMPTYSKKTRLKGWNLNLSYCIPTADSIVLLMKFLTLFHLLLQ